MKYSLRSLMIATAAMPPLIGLIYWFAGLPFTIAIVGGIAFWLFAFANRRKAQ
jgi:hypothetical protein